MASQRPGSSAEKTKEQRAPLAPAVARAIHLMNLLAEVGRPLSLSELAAHLGIVKSSAFALCTTLTAGGLLIRQPSGGYLLGVHVLHLAHAYLRQSNLPQLFLSSLDDYKVITQHTVNMSVLDGRDVVYMMSRSGPMPLGLEFRLGTRLPAFQAASGRAILSTLPPAALDEKFEDFPKSKLTPKTETSPAKVRRMLDKARIDGYSFDDEEVREGMIAYGAPVLGPDSNEAVAGVAVAMKAVFVNARERKQAISEICAFARSLSRQLGASV